MIKSSYLLSFALLLSLKSFEQKVDLKKIPFVYYRDFQKIRDSSKIDSSRFCYNKLLPKFLSNDTTLTNEEMLALMIGYTDKPEFKPLEDMAKEKEIFELVQTSQFTEAIEQSVSFLSSHPFDLTVLHQITIAYNNLRIKDSAEYYMKQHMKIMDAMIYSGTGETPETAIFSLGLADGEKFMSNIDYLIEKKDTEWDKKDNFMEVIQAADTKAVSKIFYFVIEHAKAKIDDDKANAEPTTKSKKVKPVKKKRSKEDKKSKKANTPVSPIPSDSTLSSSNHIDTTIKNLTSAGLDSTSSQDNTLQRINIKDSARTHSQTDPVSISKDSSNLAPISTSDTSNMKNIDSTKQGIDTPSLTPNTTNESNQQNQENGQNEKAQTPSRNNRKKRSRN